MTFLKFTTKINEMLWLSKSYINARSNSEHDLSRLTGHRDQKVHQNESNFNFRLYTGTSCCDKYVQSIITVCINKKALSLISITISDKYTRAPASSDKYMQRMPIWALINCRLPTGGSHTLISVICWQSIMIIIYRMWNVNSTS